MKPTPSLLAFLFGIISLPENASAIDWNQTATGTYSWVTGGNWVGGTAPNSIGASANLGIDIAAAQTISLNGAVTVGSLSYGDLSGNNGTQTIQNGTGGSLIFNNGGSGATLTMANTANANPGNVSATITLNDNLTVTNNSTATDRNSAPNFSGKISGTGKITLEKGLLWLTNTGNDYSGGFTLNGSTAKIVTGGNGAAFGSGTFTVTSLGGILDTSFSGAATQALTTSNDNNFAGTLTVSTTSNSGGWTNNGDVTLSSNFVLNINNGATVSLNGDIDDGVNTYSLARTTGNATTTLNLNGTNTYGGGTTISQGIVKFGKLASMPATGAVTMATTTTLAVNAGGVGEWSATGTGAGTIAGLLAGVGGQGNTVTWSASANNLGIDTTNAGGSLTYANTLANIGTSLGLRKSGSGKLVLSATNSTYTGVTNIAAGVLEVSVLANGGTASSIGQSANTNTNLQIGGGATLRYTGSGGSTNRAFQMTGGASSSGIIDASGSGAINFTNTSAVTNSTNNVAYFLQLTGTNTGNNTLAANIGNNGSGARNITKNGVGTWILTGTNAYTGNTTVNSGTLITTKATSLAGYTVADKVRFTGGTVGVQVGGAGWTTGEVDILLTNATKTSGALGIDTTNGSLSQWTSFTSTNLGSTLGLTKLGSNTLTLDQANTYNGATTVSAGTLALGASGTIANSPTITVTTGATLDVSLVTGGWSLGASQALGGSGTVLGNTTILGTHNPGNSPGILTHDGNLAYEGGTSVVNWELAANSSTQDSPAIFDQIVVTGDLDFSDTTTINFAFDVSGSAVDWTNAFWDTDQSWLLYDVAGTTTNFLNLSINTQNWLDSNGALFDTALPSGDFSLSLNGNDVLINYTIPEPGAALLGSLGLFLILRRRR